MLNISKTDLHILKTQSKSIKRLVDSEFNQLVDQLVSFPLEFRIGIDCEITIYKDYPYNSVWCTVNASGGGPAVYYMRQLPESIKVEILKNIPMIEKLLRQVISHKMNENQRIFNEMLKSKDVLKEFVVPKKSRKVFWFYAVMFVLLAFNMIHALWTGKL